MKRIVIPLVLLAMLLAGCTPGDGSNNRTTTNSNNRTYYVDCGNAQTIGSGSCGLTVTGIGWGQ